MIKGFAQKFGVDYDETFSPVVSFSSIRALLAYAVQNDMIVHQMDVVTAFMNGILDEEIYMEQRPGYIQAGKDHLICKLEKSLYGLKQSPRCWNNKFREYMEKIQFKESQADPCVFIQFQGTDVSIFAVYVDDLITVTKTPDQMKQIKESMAIQFKMKDLRKLHYCLGITTEQKKDEKCIALHQQQYIFALLEKYGLSQAKTVTVTTPADVNVKLIKDDGVSKAVDPATYQSIVVSLLYASIATRPDIAQAVGAVAKFCSSPTEAHLTAAKRILRYLKGTADLCLKYHKSDGKLTGYSDADWAGDTRLQGIHFYCLKEQFPGSARNSKWFPYQRQKQSMSHSALQFKKPHGYKDYYKIYK